MKFNKQHEDDIPRLRDMLYTYEKYVKPAFSKYIEPSKKEALIIIPNFGFANVADYDSTKQLEQQFPGIGLLIPTIESEMRMTGY